MLRGRRDHWAGQLAGVNGGGVVVWGAGAKGTTFLNLVDGSDRVDGVVDLNPRKQGGFVPGTGHRIDAPAALAGTEWERVIAMNSVYADEIMLLLRDLGVTVVFNAA